VTLPAWAARAIDELDASDRHAIALAGDLTGAQLNWRPAPDQWSVGQCLDHLLVANRVYLPPIAAALDGQPPSPVQEITPGWFGRWFIRTRIEPSTQRRRGRAPATIAPSQDVETSVVREFVLSNDLARNLVRRASDYDVNRIRFANPFVPLVRFTVGTGIEIAWRHQRRHLLQAERVTRAPGFPIA
jgi:hypothetical protein